MSDLVLARSTIGVYRADPLPKRFLGAATDGVLSYATLGAYALLRAFASAAVFVDGCLEHS
jgi:hypothetical protein